MRLSNVLVVEEIHIIKQVDETNEGVTKSYVDLAVQQAAISGVSAANIEVAKDGALINSTAREISFDHHFDVETVGSGVSVSLSDQKVALTSGTQDIYGVKTFKDDVTIVGDLTVFGAGAVLQTVSLVVEDSEVTLNSTATGDPVTDAALAVNRGNQAPAMLFWSESKDKWYYGISGAFKELGSNADLVTASGALHAEILAASGALADADSVFSGSLRTELDALNGTVSGKEPAITVLPVERGGTGSTVSIFSNRLIMSSGGTMVEAPLLTGNKALMTDSSGLPITSSVSNIELGFLEGVTNGVQHQLDDLTTDLAGKEPAITTLPISQGGTNSSEELSNNRVMASLNGSVKELDPLTPSGVLYANGNGLPESSFITAGQLETLSGISSNIQAQIDSKVSTSGSKTMVGDTVISGNLTVSGDTYQTDAVREQVFRSTIVDGWQTIAAVDVAPRTTKFIEATLVLYVTGGYYAWSQLRGAAYRYDAEFPVVLVGTPLNMIDRRPEDSTLNTQIIISNNQVLIQAIGSETSSTCAVTLHLRTVEGGL